MYNRMMRFYWKLYRRWQVLMDMFRGVDFSKNHSVQELGFTEKIGNMYAASPTHDLEKALNQFNIQPTDAILDLGAGKGAAMVAMTKWPFRFIGGVEISAFLTDIANQNFQKLNLKNIQVFCSDAQEFTDLDRYNYFYLFNSFPTAVFNKVLKNMEDSFERKPRRMTLIYYNPCFREAIEPHPFFKAAGGFQGRYFEVAIYTNQFSNEPIMPDFG